MNYRGLPCKECGDTIRVYSTSGYCRRCWHQRRGGKTFPGSKTQQEASSVKKVD